MALEACQYPYETYICSYGYLMKSLIETDKDVDLLVERGIIYNLAGDNAFPQLYSHYNIIYETLSSHYHRPWNHAMETLKKNYFKIGVAVFLLTLMQTVFSILQVFLPK
ncbi:hypothetical protein Patl1_12027 [Pistacia atlantica]|uniref:Uncharacterized protein n=1 Tax=Pistacia atlantica TaxID=434234 RepID=A0ACC1A981_9ROSI|nr:hypothetical protein Patl1_12027 [Pistacia atlantica]